MYVTDYSGNLSVHIPPLITVNLVAKIKLGVYGIHTVTIHYPLVPYKCCGVMLNMFVAGDI